MNGGSVDERAEFVSGDRPTIRLERSLLDPPEIVWAAITDREQLKTWFPCDVEVEGGAWRVGAAIVFRFPPDVIDMTLSGTVLEVDEPNALAFLWGDETLRIELSPNGTGTTLVLSDTLAPGAAARNATGWEDCLARLPGQRAVQGTWGERFARYASEFAPALGHQEGPPDGYKGDGYKGDG
jgi:uncharacterized protein YndB with AHSA1/START domain